MRKQTDERRSDTPSHKMVRKESNTQSGEDLDKWKNKDLWEREYKDLKVIPSSTRHKASKALLLFSEILDYQKFGVVLDAGCGIGRNALYLAQKGCHIHALDYSDCSLTQLSEGASRSGLADRITIYNRSLYEPLPFADCSIDLVLDSYVFCHFTDEVHKSSYRKELFRVLKAEGLLFSSVFSVDDEYYKRMAPQSIDRGSVVVDPNNGIAKQLYTEPEIKDFFLMDFHLAYFVKFQFKDVVLGQPFLRSIFVMLFSKSNEEDSHDRCDNTGYAKPTQRL